MQRTARDPIAQRCKKTEGPRPQPRAFDVSRSRRQQPLPALKGTQTFPSGVSWHVELSGVQSASAVQVFTKSPAKPVGDFVKSAAPEAHLLGKNAEQTNPVPHVVSPTSQNWLQ
jgi:hypothetical protein